MTVRFLVTGEVHKVKERDSTKPEIWWTECNQRFAWGTPQNGITFPSPRLFAGFLVE